MKTSSVLAMAAASTINMVSAHTTVFNIYVNDVDQGLGNSDGGYIRSPPSNSPVKDVSSTDVMCNVDGLTKAAKTVEVAGGDKITFEWHHNSEDASDDIIDPSHKGPVMTYIAPGDTTGDGWVKLAESGFDSASGTWAVDTLIADRGKHSITLPDLAAGEYLLRPEIIALHEANNVGGAQLYMECVQIKVTSEGSATLPDGVSFPGAYTAEDAGIHFDIYNGFDSYPIPGPAVWDGAAAEPADSEPAATSATAAPAATSAAAVSSAAAVVTSAPAAVTSAAAVQQTTLVTSVKQVTTEVSAPAPSSGSSTGAVQKFGQCGGINFTGATACADGWVCKNWNPYYSQCVESA